MAGLDSSRARAASPSAADAGGKSGHWSGHRSASHERAGAALLHDFSATVLGLLRFRGGARIRVVLEHEDLQPSHLVLFALPNSDERPHRPRGMWNHRGQLFQLCAVVLFLPSDAPRDAGFVGVSCSSPASIASIRRPFGKKRSPGSCSWAVPLISSFVAIRLSRFRFSISRSRSSAHFYGSDTAGRFTAALPGLPARWSLRWPCSGPLICNAVRPWRSLRRRVTGSSPRERRHFADRPPVFGAAQFF